MKAIFKNTHKGGKKLPEQRGGVGEEKDNQTLCYY